MSNPARPEFFTVEDLVQITGGRLVNGDALGAKRAEIRIGKPAALNQSKPDNIAYFFSKEYKDQLLSARPGVLITGEPFVLPLQQSGLPLWNEAAVIACADPYFAMALLSERLAIGASASAPDLARSREKKVHPRAVVHETAELGEGVEIGPNVVVEQGARIGARSKIMAGSTIGPGVVIGEECLVFPNVSIYEWVQIGNRVRIHSGAVIGADGFGYAPKLSGKEVIGQQKIYHLGRVVIGECVEIGANSCIDRGTIGDTVIEPHAKIDNQVQIAHNAHVGEGAIICGGTALAGRARVGRFAYIGGLTGITNAVEVGDGAKVGAVSLVTKNVAPGSTAVGNPQREHREHFKAHAVLSRLVSGKKSKSKAEKN